MRLLLFVALCLLGTCSAQTTLDSVARACSVTYYEGMTPEIANALGRQAVPFLHQLLATESTARPDNVVAYLAYLGDASTPKALYTYATRAAAAKPATADHYRASLLVGHALGRLAAAGVAGAIDTLRTLATPAVTIPNAADLAREALFGLVIAKDYQGIFGAVKATQANVNADPSSSVAGAIADEVLGAFEQLLYEGVPKEILEKYPDLARNGVGVAADTPTISLVQPDPEINMEGVLSLVYGAPTSTGTAVETRTRARRTNSRTWHISFCNHVATTNKVTTAQCDAILAAGTSLLRNSGFPGDVACSVTLTRSGSAASFGSFGDSLSTINTQSAMTTVLNHGCGRVKVVNVINWCGGSGTNIIGCAWTPGTGIAVVRFGTTTAEGVLWAHEFGHNRGLGHLPSDNRNIMFPSLNTFGGLTSAQCNTFNPPPPPPPPPPPSCFATDGEVEVQGRGKVRMDSLREGDMVADGSKQGFSRFVTYMHFEANTSSPFIALSFEGQTSSPLLLTPAHYVFVAGANGEMKSVRADKVSEGDVLFIGAGHTAAVSSIRYHTQEGVVGPLTESGQIMANGIVASCYSDVVNTPHETAHTVMKPLIWLSRMFPSLARHDTTHADIHWYTQILLKLWRMGDHVQAKLDEFRQLFPKTQ